MGCAFVRPAVLGTGSPAPDESERRGLQYFGGKE